MTWYYAHQGRQIGPVSVEDFNRLVSTGAITASTLVWREGMPEWSPYGSMFTGPTYTPQFSPAPGFDPMQATAATIPPAPLRYGGFWMRFLAKMIDGVILSAAAWAVGIAFGYATVRASSVGFMGMYFKSMSVSLILSLFYNVLFVGALQATPGKMLLGLKIVRPDGSRLTYLRALARHFAQWISAWIFFIGYIMAAFDDQKRALHDRICSTRVIIVG